MPETISPYDFLRAAVCRLTRESLARGVPRDQINDWIDSQFETPDPFDPDPVATHLAALEGLTDALGEDPDDA